MIRDFSGISHGSESLQKKNLPKRREAGTWLKPRRYEKRNLSIRKVGVGDVLPEMLCRLRFIYRETMEVVFTSFVVDKISIRENCDQNVYTG